MAISQKAGRRRRLQLIKDDAEHDFADSDTKEGLSLGRKYIEISLCQLEKHGSRIIKTVLVRRINKNRYFVDYGLKHLF